MTQATGLDKEGWGNEAADVVGKTATAVDWGYSVGGYVGGAAIGGWDWS
ncbi:hypothetical protein RFN58_28580 [Streptomyces iakyrus]|nr:hypothetical protein [Streptomyces iakyrus]